ncbi:MAG: hypothetical protein WCV59_03300 [Parcubacteria group bacterium]|jgi:hypothetical protein
MAIRIGTNLPKGTVADGKSLGFDPKRSKFIQGLLKDKDARGALDKPQERKLVYDAFKRQMGKTPRNITNRDVRAVLGAFGTGEIDLKERQALGKALLGNGSFVKKYDTISKEKKDFLLGKSNPVVDPRNGSLSTTKPGSSSGKSVTRHSGLF